MKVPVFFMEKRRIPFGIRRFLLLFRFFYEHPVVVPQSRQTLQVPFLTILVL